MDSTPDITEQPWYTAAMPWMAPDAPDINNDDQEDDENGNSYNDGR
jgi:hypothetical protein